jgi:hypothetical protein
LRALQLSHAVAGGFGVLLDRLRIGFGLCPSALERSTGSEPRTILRIFEQLASLEPLVWAVGSLRSGEPGARFRVSGSSTRLFVTVLDTNPSIPRRQPKVPCDSHGLRLRPSNIPDLTCRRVRSARTRAAPWRLGEPAHGPSCGRGRALASGRSARDLQSALKKKSETSLRLRAPRRRWLRLSSMLTGTGRRRLKVSPRARSGQALSQ